MNPSSFEHIVRIQFNALMMTVIKCTVKNRNRQFARRSKREVLFCELSDTKNVECVTKDNYSCDYISFEVLNFTIQISNEKLAVALYKLSNKERDVILLRYFQSMSDQEIAELYHVSRSAIYRRRSNGLKKLKTVLKERQRRRERTLRVAQKGPVDRVDHARRGTGAVRPAPRPRAAGRRGADRRHRQIRSLHPLRKVVRLAG